ncbi:16141_t:CDS:2, partial [Gigaspora margarita]
FDFPPSDPIQLLLSLKEVSNSRIKLEALTWSIEDRKLAASVGKPFCSFTSNDKEASNCRIKLEAL